MRISSTAPFVSSPGDTAPFNPHFEDGVPNSTVEEEPDHIVSLVKPEIIRASSRPGMK